jgi:hypothetical protein
LRKKKKRARKAVSFFNVYVILRFYELANETIKLMAAVMKTNSQKSFALNLLSSPFINSPFSLKICSVYERIFFSEYSMQKLCNKLKMLKFRSKENVSKILANIPTAKSNRR